MVFKAQIKSIAKQPVWALIFLALLLVSLGFAYSKRIQPPPEALTLVKSGVSRESTQELLRDVLHSSCPKNKSNPELYAQFLARPIDGQFSIGDMLSSKEEASVCAPGPFLIENSRTADLSQKAWQLASTPNFFVWRLSPGTIEDADLYLTNQNGFPLKSKSYTLNEEGKAILVLLLEANLEPGKYYYLYLSQQANDSKQRWIQPISLTAQASQADESEE